jgi:hypothetical protein
MFQACVRSEHATEVSEYPYTGTEGTHTRLKFPNIRTPAPKGRTHSKALRLRQAARLRSGRLRAHHKRNRSATSFEQVRFKTVVPSKLVTVVRFMDVRLFELDIVIWLSILREAVGMAPVASSKRKNVTDASNVFFPVRRQTP